LQVYHWDAFDPAGPNYLKTKPWVAAQNTPVSFYETAISTAFVTFTPGRGVLGLSSTICFKLPNVYGVELK
jgi:hypothetical protein